jgi:hypothetical protein
MYVIKYDITSACFCQHSVMEKDNCLAEQVRSHGKKSSFHLERRSHPVIQVDCFGVNLVAFYG